MTVERLVEFKISLHIPFRGSSSQDYRHILSSTVCIGHLSHSLFSFIIDRTSTRFAYKQLLSMDLWSSAFPVFQYAGSAL